MRLFIQSTYNSAWHEMVNKMLLVNMFLLVEIKVKKKILKKQKQKTETGTREILPRRNQHLIANKKSSREFSN